MANDNDQSLLQRRNQQRCNQRLPVIDIVGIGIVPHLNQPPVPLAPPAPLAPLAANNKRSPFDDINLGQQPQQ